MGGVRGEGHDKQSAALEGECGGAAAAAATSEDCQVRVQRQQLHYGVICTKESSSRSSEGRKNAGFGEMVGRRKKRFRSKFSSEQKMMEFAERVEWRVQKKYEELEAERFCREIGVSRQVLNVWMHKAFLQSNNCISISQ